MHEEIVDENWFVRDNMEVDENLPDLACEVIRRGIDFTDESQETTMAMVEVLRDKLKSFSDMTTDEIVSTLKKLDTACILTAAGWPIQKSSVDNYDELKEEYEIEQELLELLPEMEEEGLVHKDKNGSYTWIGDEENNFSSDE